MKKNDVVIVGGGPVGMGLAIELGLRGIGVTVVERFDQPQLIPKGQNLTQRTMEHFHFWGIEKALRAARTIPTDYGIGGLTAYGTLLSDFCYDWMKRETVRRFFFTDNERLPQYETEAVLCARAAEIDGIDILYGWSGETIDQDENGVTVTIASPANGERRALRASYAVGCDGSRSITREQVGIIQTLTDHDRRMVLLVFRSEELHALLQHHPGKSFYCVVHPDLAGYWMFFGRVDLGSTWFFHAPVPMDTTRDNYDFAAYLHRAVGQPFGVDIEHIGFWDLRFAVADSYRQGRVFIAGDAAHSHPPYGGYGINTGFEDARNLGWKLAAVLQGWGGEALLDSYDAERRPVFASTADAFIANFIEEDRAFLQRYHPEKDRAEFEQAWSTRNEADASVQAYEPHYEGSPIVFGPPDGICSAVGQHRFGARPGHHLSPQMLSSGRNLYEALGDGFSLVALDADPADVQAFARAADDLGLPLTIIADSFADGRERLAVRLILVRPDQHVAWTGDRAGEDVGKILGRAAGLS
ncbi:MAG: FAD-dependent monooxygenase [Alphaproteobacteria bacterium]